MKLHYHPFSPNCRKVRATAVLLDLPLELQVVDIPTGAQRSDSYLALNPNGMVPTLEDGDFVLWESNAIMQYLASKRPNHPLWPQDDRARADICRWQCWELAHWDPACGVYLWENMFKGFMNLGAPDASELAKAEEKFTVVASVLDSHLAKHEHLAGKHLTLADLSVVAFLMFPVAQIPVDRYPNIRRWQQQVEDIDAWRRTAPPSM